MPAAAGRPYDGPWTLAFFYRILARAARLAAMDASVDRCPCPSLRHAAIAGALALLVLAWGASALAAQGSADAVRVARFSLEVPPAGEEAAVRLPAPAGPHAVGTVTFHWVLDRPEELTPSPSDRREVMAQLFYPAEPADPEGRAPRGAYVPELPLLLRGLLVHGFPPFAETSERMASYAAVGIDARAGARPLRRGANFPVVLVSPGGNMSRHWHTGLAQELASHGYAVAVVSHAHSGMDVFPGGGFLASHLHWHPGDDVPEAEVEARDRQLALRLASDVEAVVDGLDRLDPSEDLAGRLDLERRALIGHSRGGSTVTAACGGASRFAACVTFDNVGSVAGLEPPVSQPRLVLRAPWPKPRAERLAAILAETRTDAFDVVIPGTVHDSFTDLVLVDPTGHPSGELPAGEAHRLVAGLTRAFLDRYVRGRRPDFAEAVRRQGGAVEMRVFGQ